MKADSEVQFNLISPDPPIYKIRLEAQDSPKQAYYEIEIHHLPGSGFLIRKLSGAKGAKPNLETWHRPTHRLAQEKASQLVTGKLNKQRKGGSIQ